VNTTKKRFANARDGYIGSARHFVQELEMAEARRPGEAYDSVGIFYTLVVRGKHDYALESVRFIGGPGTP
jgi:hypothetical protein